MCLFPFQLSFFFEIFLLRHFENRHARCRFVQSNNYARYSQSLYFGGIVSSSTASQWKRERERAAAGRLPSTPISWLIIFHLAQSAEGPLTGHHETHTHTPRLDGIFSLFKNHPSFLFLIFKKRIWKCFYFFLFFCLPCRFIRYLSFLMKPQKRKNVSFVIW